MTAERPTVAVTTRSFGSGAADPAAYLASCGFRVERGHARHDLDALAPLLAEVVAWIAGTGPITAAHLDAAPGLRLVARYGVGIDAVDRQALARHDVLLTNTPGANTEAVADHAVGLMLAALRSTLAGDASLRGDGPAPGPGRELGTSTVGIVGYGAIGRAVHRRLRGFGANVLAHDPFIDPATVDVELLDLEDLAARAEIVTLHAPPGPDPIVDEAFVSRLPEGAVIVNTARADLLDEAVVAEALVAGRVAALASDVLSTETGGDSPLLGAPHVTLTPHLAGQTVDAIDRMGMGAAEEVVRVVRDGLDPRHPVPPPPQQE